MVVGVEMSLTKFQNWQEQISEVTKSADLAFKKKKKDKAEAVPLLTEAAATSLQNTQQNFLKLPLKLNNPLRLPT